MTKCLDENQLLDLLSGELPETERLEIEQHLDGCHDCRRLVGEAVTTPAGLVEKTGSALVRGTGVGRYVVLELVGAGGMGAVYAAYDPELDRRVALKLLRPTADGADASSGARLLREAQTMARLSHPNIVAIYDVGTFEDQVFLVMELVEGQTLSDWLRAEERGWREILVAFVQAGRGLAAAHAAGVVHRDFKPANVLVREDGRVQVTDFGLARQLEGGKSPSVASDDTPEAMTLTRTGALVGTPAYMAPEQIEGRPSDARTDQFSFCVALYEALFGRRPFEGDSWDDLRSAVVDGKVGETVGKRTVPQWIRRAVLLGLRADAAARHPSMQALLHALTRDPRKRLLAAVVALLFVGLLTALVLSWRRDSPPSPCKGAGGKVGVVWNRALREKIARAFETAQKRWGREAWRRVEKPLDAYARGWAAMRRDACLATHVRGVQSGSLLDLRMACLDRRLAALSAASTLFSKADSAIVRRATQVVQGLPDLGECAAAKALRQRLEPPQKENRAPVANLQKKLAKAFVRFQAGKYRDAKRQMKAILAEARALGYRPLLAEALHRWGRMHLSTDPKRAAKPLVEAFHLAQASRHDVLLAAIATLLISNVGYRLGRPDEGLAWALHAKSAIDRIGGDPILEARRLSGLGLIMSRSDAVRALRLHRRALALQRRHFAEDDLRLATSLTNIGVVLLDMGRWEEALRMHERALRIRERAQGTSHPRVAEYRANYAMTLFFNYRFADAEHAFEAAIRTYERALGKDHPALLVSLGGLGQVLTYQGRYDKAAKVLERAAKLVRGYRKKRFRAAMPIHALGDLAQKRGHLGEAERRFRKAMAISTTALGPEAPIVSVHLTGLGLVAFGRKQYRRALEYFEKAASIRRKKLGPNNAQVATALVLIGRVYLRLGDLDRAMASFARARAIEEKGKSRHHPDGAESLTGIAEVHLVRRHPKRALAPLRRAMTLQSKDRGDPQALAWTRFALARALWRTGGDRTRALRLAREARDIYQRIPFRAHELTDVRRWLRSPR